MSHHESTPEHHSDDTYRPGTERDHDLTANVEMDPLDEILEDIKDGDVPN